MSRIKEWGDEQAEEGERQAFVEHLIDTEALEGTALGVASKYVHEGRGVLSEKQLYVLETHVFGEHLVTDCARCGSGIPMSEQIAALDSGLCGYCEHMLNKDD